MDCFSAFVKSGARVGRPTSHQSPGVQSLPPASAHSFMYNLRAARQLECTAAGFLLSFCSWCTLLRFTVVKVCVLSITGLRLDAQRITAGTISLPPVALDFAGGAVVTRSHIPAAAWPTGRRGEDTLAEVLWRCCAGNNDVDACTVAPANVPAALTVSASDLRTKWAVTSATVRP